MLYRVDSNLKKPQALCLAPTRELARQIMQVVKAMGKFTQTTMYLAVPGNDVARGEKVTGNIVVGTPGKVEGLIKSKTLLTNDIKVIRSMNYILYMVFMTYPCRSMFLMKLI